MKTRKLLFLLPILSLSLIGCGTQDDVHPTSLIATSNEVRLIINSERNLNDIVTLKFEPKNVTNKSVTWSSEQNDVFTLTGSTIKANNLGSAVVTATSVMNNNLSVNITIRVHNPDANFHSVSVNESDEFNITGLQDEYEEGSEVTFAVNVLNSEKEIREVKANNDILTAISGTTYKFNMPNENVLITVTLKDIVKDFTSKYNIKYNLGDRKTAKAITTTDELMNMFELDGDSQDIINSVSQMEYIYGGGNGGSGENSWYTGDMLKIGTTSVNGSVTLSLNQAINRIKITGYISDNASKIRVGSSTSADWTDDENDNKTTLFTCSEMNETSKDIIDGMQTSTITIDFADTDTLKIATTNKKPIFITAIEFIVNSNVEQ